VVLHPFIVGQPHRLRPLRDALARVLQRRGRLWVARPGELAAYVEGLPAGLVP